MHFVISSPSEWCIFKIEEHRLRTPGAHLVSVTSVTPHSKPSSSSPGWFSRHTMGNSVLWSSGPCVISSWFSKLLHMPLSSHCPSAASGNLLQVLQCAAFSHDISFFHFTSSAPLPDSLDHHVPTEI